MQIFGVTVPMLVVVLGIMALFILLLFILYPGMDYLIYRTAPLGQKKLTFREWIEDGSPRAEDRRSTD